MIVKWKKCHKDNAKSKMRQKKLNKIFIFNAWGEFCNQRTYESEHLKKKMCFAFDFVPRRNNKRKFCFGFDVIHLLRRLRCLYSLNMLWPLSYYVCRPVLSVLCTLCTCVMDCARGKRILLGKSIVGHNRREKF